VTWTVMSPPVRPAALMAACAQDAPPGRALQFQPLRSPLQWPPVTSVASGGRET
jgi:hypothetical protein